MRLSGSNRPVTFRRLWVLPGGIFGDIDKQLLRRRRMVLRELNEQRAVSHSEALHGYATLENTGEVLTPRESVLYAKRLFLRCFAFDTDDRWSSCRPAPVQRSRPGRLGKGTGRLNWELGPVAP